MPIGKDLGHWQTSCKVPSEFFGFIYLITSPCGKKYIGRKQAQTIRKTARKGFKRKQTVSKPSNWKTYTGSSKKLNADIQKYGKESFTFEILHFCQSLSELAIMETTEILNRNALFSKDYYNEYCYLKIIHKK